MQAAIGETRGAVDEDVVEGDSGAAAQHTKPEVRELPCPEPVVGTGNLQIGFDAVHKLASLPRVTDLNAAIETRRIGAAATNAAPLITEIGADIGTRPA